MKHRNPRQQLSEAGLLAKKSFGQNFLTDPNICAKIANLAGTSHVVEIGAGLGALTAPLLERAAHVIAVERDRDLVPCLRERFTPQLEQGKLEVYEADAKTFDYEVHFRAASAPRVLTGNLPYQITGPLLERAVLLAPLIERAVFMVQLEVAERVAAAPGSKTYGALSVFVQAAFEARRAFIVKRTAFHPQPNVDSAVIELISRRPALAEETPLFRALVKGAFAARRKTLRNAWRGVAGELLQDAAGAAEIDLDRRGETLDVRDFARMERELLARGGQA
ncbi:MAG: ribosomal RNA small subunit methyltransferase A [Polyangiaceae bacterium]|nr:ribosomal RNA small subunit methyltransferase A [Myxococcales bacterium]MCB9588743.1 ribosomal RNA small subunit methyltransferase A [Polyangiaceae bacterium]MCB9605301.1 ribosomal RNA small subunit methyltransferase A [Polyangiaceae bacterium]